jgi:hypothetical protein
MLPQVPQEMRSPSCAFAQQDDPDNLSTHGAPDRVHGSDCSVRYDICEPSGFLESSSSKVRGSGWLRSASDPDGPVRRNIRAPRSRFEPGRCLGAKDEKLLSG